MSTSFNYSRATFVVIASIAALTYGLLIYSTRFAVGPETYFTLVDDVMVSMRYAMHLAAGHGLVWNIGEAPVEGFTNLSWTSFMAIVHLFPIPDSKISLVIMLASAGILVGNLYFIKRIADHIGKQTLIVSILSVLLTAFYFPLLFWSLRGMEVGLFVLLTSVGTLLTFRSAESPTKRDTGLLSLVVVALLLTRPEGLMSVFLFIVYLGYHSFKGRDWSTTSTIVITAGVTLVVFESFRLIYFGELFPNTYYLKMTGTPLFERLGVGLDALIAYAVPDLWLPAILIVTAAILTPRAFDRRISLLLAIFVGSAFYSVYVGGDYAEDLVGGANRYVTLGSPYLFIASAVAVHAIIKPVLKDGTSFQAMSKTLYVALVAAGITLFLNNSVGMLWDWRSGNVPMFDADVWRAERGVIMRLSTQPDAVIAVHAAGQMPYYSRRTVVDLLGKNDPFIAKQPQVGEFRPGHNKWNYGHSVANKKPDIVADEWGESPLFLEGSTNAYIRLANGVWVDRASLKVDHLIASGYLLPWSKITPPQDLPELDFWLDAQQLVDLQDGDLVERWPDGSGSGHDASQPALAQRPTYRTALGIPTVSFDGVDDFLRVQDDPDIRFARSDFSIIIVFTRDENKKTNLRLLSKGAMDNEQPGYGIDGSDTRQVFRVGDGKGRLDVSVRHSGPYQVNVLSFVVNRDGEAAARQPGDKILSMDASKLGSIASTIDLHIGSSPNPSLFWDGDVAEIIFYGRSLDREEVESLSKHLATKWLAQR